MQSGVLASLASANGKGVVRLESTYGTSAVTLWGALTEPQQLSHWLGEVQGELIAGGTFSAHFVASGWEGSGEVELCEPSRRLVIRTRSDDDPDGRMEVTLTPGASGTLLVFEDSGMPLAQIAAYGAGDQIHLEDLAAYLDGAARCDARARWSELHPGFDELARGLAPDEH